MRFTSIFGDLKGLGALAVAFAGTATFGPGSAQGALEFQTDAPTYSAGPNGSPQASVRIFLVQTNGTTTISDGGGLNGYGLRVTLQNPPANPPQLVAIQSNPAFNFNAGPDDEDSNFNLATQSVNDSRTSLTSGVAAESPNRWYLATFVYSGQAANGLPAANTTFRIGRRQTNSDDTFTPNGPSSTTSLEVNPGILPGTFTVNVVPEPATTAALVGIGGLGLIARRRRTPA